MFPSGRRAAAVLLALVLVFAESRNVPAPEIIGRAESSGTQVGRQLMEELDLAWDDPLWDDYTHFRQFIRGLKTEEVTFAMDATECVKICDDHSSCIYWTWCPSNETSGCPIWSFTSMDEDARDEVLPAGTCILSKANVGGATLTMSWDGESNTWWGGQYTAAVSLNDISFSLTEESPSPSFEPLESPSPSFEPSAEVVLPEGAEFMWRMGISLYSDAPSCWDLATDDFTDGPSAYAARRYRDTTPSSEVEVLALEYCLPAGQDASRLGQKLHDAIMAGGEEAQNNLAAILHARFGLEDCLAHDTVTDIVAASDSIVGEHLQLSSCIQKFQPRRIRPPRMTLAAEGSKTLLTLATS